MRIRLEKVGFEPLQGVCRVGAFLSLALPPSDSTESSDVSHLLSESCSQGERRFAP